MKSKELSWMSGAGFAELWQKKHKQVDWRELVESKEDEVIAESSELPTLELGDWAMGEGWAQVSYAAPQEWLEEEKKGIKLALQAETEGIPTEISRKMDRSGTSKWL
ncbi:MAG: hypothetical protein HC904_17605 [Blastochloris sp.]|nr:hypothetical protein [Blastochloris sp.]